jgi:hypothetical protein
MKKANTANPGKGLWYWPGYLDECNKGTPGFTWDEKYRFGFSQSGSLTRTSKPFEWKLNPGAKASVALGEWMSGLTVADCASVGAASYYQAILNDVGAEKFDNYFAAEGENPMIIGQFMKRMPLRKLVFEPNRAVDLKEGDWYYFQNHPLYEKKHPRGLWSGENAVYQGGGMWGGFGVKPKTEDEMNNELVERYKDDRSGADNEELKQYLDKDGKLPPEWEIDKLGGKVPNEISLKELLDSGGGLQKTGWRISDAKLQKQMEGK